MAMAISFAEGGIVNQTPLLDAWPTVLVCASSAFFFSMCVCVGLCRFVYTRVHVGVGARGVIK